MSVSNTFSGKSFMWGFFSILDGYVGHSCWSLFFAALTSTSCYSVHDLEKEEANIIADTSSSTGDIGGADTDQPLIETGFCAGHPESTTHIGYIRIKTVEDVGALRELTCIDGPIGTIYPADVAISLPNLRVISGDIRHDCIDEATGTPRYDCSLASIRAPLIERVGGNLYIWGNLRDIDISLPSLKLVGGSVTINDLYEGHLDIGDLAEIRGDFTCNASLSMIWADALRTVGGNLSWASNRNLDAVYLESLEDVGGELSFPANDELAAIELPALRRAGSFVLTANSALETLKADSLETVRGPFTIIRTSLDAISLPSLTNVSGAMQIIANQELLEIALPRLEEVGVATTCNDLASGDALIIGDNILLTAIDIESLSSVERSISIYRNSRLSCDMEAILDRMDFYCEALFCENREGCNDPNLGCK